MYAMVCMLQKERSVTIYSYVQVSAILFFSSCILANAGIQPAQIHG